jgi:hypothetical protein
VNIDSEDRITIANVSYPILRIFASWPAPAKLERTLDLKELQGGKATLAKSRAEFDEDDVYGHDADPHPLATVRMDNFVEISKRLAKSWYRNDTEQTVVIFAKDQYNDEVQV